jgi:hypothetical protein
MATVTVYEDTVSLLKTLDPNQLNNELVIVKYYKNKDN